ncbi:MUTL protein homolog 1 [Actinidia rufa]|uniref:MUTL protein homolog 1 n=1 Tax=Actinidia rufa TaxID=165716 RepID=A0A7J0E4B8_9ERIC|nr:MUTL protein homolog 1 [Actinidia rufa]
MQQKKPDSSWYEYRHLARHAHPGSPYVFGLVGVDHDLDFPEPMPVVGISRSAKGYCIISVLETMKTYSTDDELTEEALVTKLRTCQYHHLFLHTSLKHNSSGTCRWGEFGEGGLLWGECRARPFEWFEGNPVNELLSKVKELYGLEDKVTFRNITVVSENRPRVIRTEGIPCLLKVLLPSDCTGLPVLEALTRPLDVGGGTITSMRRVPVRASHALCAHASYAILISARRQNSDLLVVKLRSDRHG